MLSRLILLSPTKPIQSDGILIPFREPWKDNAQIETNMPMVLTGYRGMARPVVPIRVGRGVVRVDVARTIVGTIVQVAPTPNSTHCVGINEVGVRKEIHTEVHCNPKFEEIITELLLLYWLLLENNDFRYSKKYRKFLPLTRHV